MVGILLLSGAPAVGAAEEEPRLHQNVEQSAADAELEAAVKDADTPAKMFMLKRKYSTRQPDATAPQGSGARQAAAYAESDLLEMSGYGGVNTAAISRTASARALVAAKGVAAAARGQDAPVVVRSSMTKDDLLAAKIRVAEVYAQYATDADGMTYAFDAARDAVVVSGKLSSELAAHLRGISHVQVDVDPSAEVTRDTGERYADAGPWHFGNAWIRNSATGDSCTSGFNMFLNNDAMGYGTTAGHCGRLHDKMYSGSHYYGQIQPAPFPLFDIAKITCCEQKYGRQLYTTRWSVREQLSAWDPGVGLPGNIGVCVSGQKSGYEYCYMRVVSTDANFCEGTKCTYGLFEYRHDDGIRATVPGDSGAAVYSTNAGKMQIHGLHVGSRSYSGGRTQLAEKYGTVQARFGGAVRSW
jgi:hypothetical protein